MIAICLPSRGLIYAITVKSVIEGMQALNQIGLGTIFTSSRDLPIPDAHNYCVETALQNKAVDRIIIIEEDMYLSPEAFVALATSEHPIAMLQYNDKNGSPHGIIHYNEAGEILWGGVGAVKIDREIFDKLGTPYFRTDNRYKNVKTKIADGRIITDYELLEKHEEWNEEEKKFVERSEPYQYGGLDVDFYTRARKAGYKIVCLPDFKALHFKLVALGKDYDNNGCHTIIQV